MRAVQASLAFLLIIALVTPGAEAAINHARPYSAQFGYMPGFNGASLTMASGAMDATMASAEGTLGFFSTGGADITGLTKVCWTAPSYQCATSPGGSLHIVAAPGGSFGLQVPGSYDVQVDAAHALAMFADLADQGDLNSLGLGRSLVAPLVAGHIVVTGLQSIPDGTLATPQSTGSAAVAATDLGTTLEVRDGAALRATLRDKAQPILFSGAPVLSPLTADFAVLPFLGAGAQAHFSPAAPAAAREGLDIGRINAMMQKFYSANRGSDTQAAAIDAASFGPFQEATAALFAGAVLSLPTNGAPAKDDLSFARVTTLQVRGTPGNALAWTGSATLDVHGGHVAGAKKMYGFALFKLPWWSWVLWAIGIGLWITRLTLKPEKHHATWDRFRWVGWVVSPLAYLLVLFLWDLEVKAVLGLSLLSGHLGGQVLLIVGAFELATFFGISFAAIAPLRMLLRNSFLLLRQGTFMGLSGGIASLVGFLLGATYLRSYLDILVSQAMAALS